MNAAAARKLVELNREFYARFGAEFSATRRRIQPGTRRILESLRGDETILDLGCGNGELARELERRGFRGIYFGLDFSPPLLQAAASSHSFPAQFLQADLTSPDWSAALPPERFNVIFAFAALHHIPGEDLRLNLLSKIKELLKDGGRFVLSNWQFLNSPKLRARIQPWRLTGLPEEEADAGDYLLDWRSGGTGLRYAHHFSAEELSALASRAGMRVRESFLSDGEGGNLSLYQVWERG